MDYPEILHKVFFLIKNDVLKIWTFIKEKSDFPRFLYRSIQTLEKYSWKYEYVLVLKNTLDQIDLCMYTQNLLQ